MNRNVLITRPTNHLGLPVNEAHHLARFSDAQVRRARALRAGGATVRAIAAAIGCHPSTAHRWVNHSMRRPAVSVRVVRLKTPESPPSGRALDPRSPGDDVASHPGLQHGLQEPSKTDLSDADIAALRTIHGDIA